MALWILFGAIVAVMLALDLGVFHRRAHRIELKEALVWTGVWVALALAFCLVVFLAREDGGRKAAEYLACYLTEKALSVDNIFVFLVIFRYFAVPPESQHRVLFWGILGALAMRALFIWLGVAMIERFHWTVYVLGAFLVVTGVRLAFEDQREVHPERNPVLRLFRRFVPVTHEYEGGRFFVRRAGRTVATPLLFTLVAIETTDVLFAVDSVPAAIAITPDRFILYTSNVMAILGLRALYFAVAHVVGLFRYLHWGLALILVFVGSKMLLGDVIEIPVVVALGVVAGILVLSVAVSLALARGRDGPDRDSPPPPPPQQSRETDPP